MVRWALGNGLSSFWTAQVGRLNPNRVGIKIGALCAMENVTRRWARCVLLSIFPVLLVPPASQAQPPKAAEPPQNIRKPLRVKGDYTFDDLKFEIEKGGNFERSMLTKQIEEIDKKPMRIRGYILPTSTYRQSGITEFVLVRDNMECCFGPGAAIYDCIMVQMEKGKTANFSVRPVAVRGKFAIEEYRDTDGSLLAIYKLIASEVK